MSRLTTTVCTLGLGAALTACNQAAPPPAAVATPAPTAPPSEIVIPGERLIPESLTSTANGAVIVGSVLGRTIFRAAPGAGTATAWITPGTDDLTQVFGVFADDASGTLWACAATPAFVPRAADAPPAPPSRLHAFDLGTGAPKGKWDVPTAGGFCNDIAVDRNGNAYITDTQNMEVARLAKGGTALEVWIGGGVFGPSGGVLDGIAVIGDRLYVNALATSKLFVVPIGADGKAGTASEVKLDRPIERPDGQRAWSDKLLVVEGGGPGRLSRVDLAADGLSGTVTTLKEGFPDGPVAVTVVGSTAYVLEAQFGAMAPPKPGEPPPVPKPFKATAVPLGSS